MEMTLERKSAQDADSLSGLEKLRKQRSAFPHSHRPGGHPQDLTNPRGGPNQMIKSGPDRVDKPIRTLIQQVARVSNDVLTSLLGPVVDSRRLAGKSRQQGK